MHNRRAIFDLFVCSSLVNLLLLRVWAQLLPAVVNPANLYYMERAPEAIHYLTVLVSLFGAAATLTLALQWSRRSARSWAAPLVRSALLVCFLGALNAIVGQFPEAAREALLRAISPAALWTVGIAAAVLLGGLAVFRAALVFGAIEIFAIFASPFLLMTVGQAGWAWVTHDPARFAGASLASEASATPLPTPPGATPRVVWILFDELDQHAAFEARPAGLALPEFDRMSREAFAGRSAFAPAGETRRSVASMLLGRQIVSAMPSGASILPCTIAAGPATLDAKDCWSEHRNLFEELRGQGVNSAVAGWYHPYCRLFGRTLARCTWSGLPYWNSSRILDSFDQQWEEIVKAIPVARDWLRPGTRIRSAHAKSFAAIRDAALEIAADPGIGFALLHFPVPHHPDIYDPAAGVLSVTDRRSYFDNLALADRTLGELRSAMDSAGLWDRTTVIVTSDHWWRAIHRGDWGLQPEEEVVFGDGANRRIPFLAKFPGQSTRFVYGKAFNTVLLHGFTLGIFANRIATPVEAAGWLDRARLDAPIPYPVPDSAQRPKGRRLVR